MKSMENRVIGVVLLCLAICAGCSGKSGPEKFVVSGTVTMADGKPAPAGEIMFEPDAEGGNSGPGSMVQFREGQYSLPRDQGIIGGKYIAYITPYDGVTNPMSPLGTPLASAPFMEKVDLPAEDSTKDFKLPK
jgi:hypothetical protein